MRFGLLEIGIIIAVVLVIFIATRMVRLGQSETPAEDGKREDNRKAGRLRITGIAFILIGIVALLVSVSLLKWILWGNLWAFIIIAIGLLIIYLSRCS